MSFIFGKKKTVQQQIREKKREVDRAVRSIDTEIARLEKDKAKLGNEIRKFAKQNEMDSVKVLAVQIARTNRQIKHFTSARTNLQVIGHKLQTISCTETMARTMKEITGVMKRMNAGTKPLELQKILMEFAKQSDLLESKEELISDAIDDAFEDDEVESENVVNAVLAELGIELSEQVSGLPVPAGSKIATSGPTPTALPAGASDGPAPSLDGTIAEDDLEARLARLKRG